MGGQKPNLNPFEGTKQVVNNVKGTDWDPRHSDPGQALQKTGNAATNMAKGRWSDAANDMRDSAGNWGRTAAGAAGLALGVPALGGGGLIGQGIAGLTGAGLVNNEIERGSVSNKSDEENARQEAAKQKQAQQAQQAEQQQFADQQAATEKIAGEGRLQNFNTQNDLENTLLQARKRKVGASLYQ